MSQEHEQPKPDASPVSDEIRLEASPFEPGYQPETLPQLHVPDLPADVQSLSAEALAQVPTLTELVEPEPEPAAHAPQTQDVGEPAEQPEDMETAADSEAVAAEQDSELIQEPPAQADTWAEQLQARMGKLSDDIHTLNARLDRLEERNNTKV